MASGGVGEAQNLSDGLSGLYSSGVWKGENESDAEQMESYESPIANAGVWTEEEAYKLYREKLVRLRDLYVGQFEHLRHTLQEKRRQFLLQWQQQARRKKHVSEPLPTPKGRGHESSAYRRYRVKSGEAALLEHKLKQKRCAASLEYFLKRDPRDGQKQHNQYLIRQHHRLSQPSTSQQHCSNHGCENRCLPFSTKCSRHICDDSKQLLYTKCTYIYPSGNQCTNPVPKYLDPLLCGGHCDNIRPPDCGVEGGGDSIRGATTLGLGLGQDRLTSTSETQGDLEAIEASGEKEAKAETSLNL